MNGIDGDSTIGALGYGRDREGQRTKTVLLMPMSCPITRKLAKQFAFSDNFYCDGDASIHGHHWMMGVIPNEWVETNSKTGKTGKIFSTAPGRRFPGSTGSMDPGRLRRDRRTVGVA